MEQSYSTSFTVNQPADEVFQAINNVRSWWSHDIEGDTAQPGAIFRYRFKDIHRCTMRITEFLPNEKVVWHVMDNFFSFTEDKSEWKDTTIVFEISRKDGQTEVRFTHVGLVSEFECYTACQQGWNQYINGSLQQLIATGQGQPNVGEAITESEQALG
ncbi:SRPBCC domain-containing protein [Paenibacillus aurantius]|uniref:SRPBCC domain-containing protein n=1 Tax=Paenibacillus aurantius TaxID=2918900 RepID=A0AA96LEJ4_9BACL|nr:SRPBCC domain-containing protein [Paenibacillus aurantius]WJH36925.1 SRPBCC domain-containing protein [Paenibacillus sp. CC-CFT747]WNQ12276.1 SRPBCC domain-containing protein [Paenibacillus aurantius]